MENPSLTPSEWAVFSPKDSIELVPAAVPWLMPSVSPVVTPNDLPILSLTESPIERPTESDTEDEKLLPVVSVTVSASV